MTKLQLIVLILTGTFSFTVAFGTGFVLKRNKAIAAATTHAASAQNQTQGAKPGAFPPSDLAENISGQANLSENQLKSLISDLQEKMDDVKTRQHQIEDENERITITRQTLAAEIEQLNQLRENINQTLLTLQEKERSIQNSLTEIETVEKANLVKIAATYDKMDPAQSAKILTTMASNNQIKDAVKILYYMSERTAGKLLGEIGTTRPDTAGTLSLLLKQIQEKP